MSLVRFKSTTLDTIIPRIPRRLVASSASRTSKAAKTNTSLQANYPKIEHLFFPSSSKEMITEASRRTPGRRSLAATANTSRSAKPAAKNSTADVSPAVNSSHAVSSLPSPGTAPITPTAADQAYPAPYQHSPPLRPPLSPLTRWVLASPFRSAVVLKLGDLLGYGSPKQVAGRRSKIIYNECSEVAQGPEQDFWYNSLSLPPSFQSWFTITNLHVWLATVRLRSLPPSHGRHFVQALIDHFFYDVEDRLRAVLGKKAPERLVTRHMKIFREQWNGLGLACDMGLITGDKDMASAMWRNLLGARGAGGIAYPDSVTPSPDATRAPSEPIPSSPVSDALPRLDPSNGGVVDFEGAEIEKYLMYPQLMLTITSYLRRELVRLEGVSDAVILGGEGHGMRDGLFESAQDAGGGGAATVDLSEAFRFGSVKDAARQIDAELDSS